MISPVSIRPTSPDDNAAIGLLLESSYSVLMQPYYKPRILDTALPFLTRAKPILLASGTFFVAEDPNGNALGCGGWTREQPGKGDAEPGLGHIRHFATHPDHTGRGIGRSLYNTCVRQAKSAGITRFECYASLNAVNFYSALGFEEIEAVDVKLGDWVNLPGVLMGRSVVEIP